MHNGAKSFMTEVFTHGRFCVRMAQVVRLRWFQYCVVTGIYVLEWWEAVVLHMVFFMIAWLSPILVERVFSSIYG